MSQTGTTGSTSIVVGYVAKPEGEAALNRAMEEARARGAGLVVVSARHPDPDPAGAAKADADLAVAREQLEASGIQFEIRESELGIGGADALVEAAEELDADLIVIGLRKRSPTGKLILGTQAQKILLDAPCAVLSVKPE